MKRSLLLAVLLAFGLSACDKPAPPPPPPPPPVKAPEPTPPPPPPAPAPAPEMKKDDEKKDEMKKDEKAGFPQGSSAGESAKKGEEKK